MIYEIQYQSLFLPVGPNEELGSQVINEFEDENTEQFYDGEFQNLYIDTIIMADLFSAENFIEFYLDPTIDEMEGDGTSIVDFGLHNAVFESVLDVHFAHNNPHFPGKIARPGHLVTSYERIISGGLVTFVPNANRIYYVPIHIPVHAYFQYLGVEINALPADITKQARIGLYKCDRGVPQELVYQNLITLNSTSIRWVPCNLWLSVGLYMLAFITEATDVTLIAGQVQKSVLGVPVASGFTKPPSFMYEDYTFAALPSTAGETVVSDGDSPLLYMRLAQ